MNYKYIGVFRGRSREVGLEFYKVGLLGFALF
jgi:hypothetical protein